MTDLVIKAATDAVRLISENRLSVQSLSIEDSPADAAVGHPAITVSVGHDPRALLGWARCLDVDSVRAERRTNDVMLRVDAVKDGIAWRVLGSYHKSLTPGSRNRFPGITVQWERGEVSGNLTSRGRISASQLEVLIDRLGV